MNPTSEQQAALGAFLSGCQLALVAGAGTGKTSTCELLARHTSRPGQYIVFNRAASLDAGARMPMNVSCSTVHSLAFRAVGRDFAHRLGGDRVPSAKLAKLLDVRPILVHIGARPKMLQPGYLASLTIRALKRFCQSADTEPGARHFPYVDGIDERRPDGRKGHANNRSLAEALAPTLLRAWDDWQAEDGDLPYDHGGYLKAWSLGEPALPVDFLLADEAQDLSPVMLRVLRYNAERGCQVVLVGDPMQAIYGWAGAVDAFEHFQTDVTSLLTQSFRFGPAIADVANTVLATLEAPFRLRGTDTILSRVAAVNEPRAVLCRTNAHAVSVVLAQQNAGRHPHLVGGAADVVRFAVAVAELQEKGRTRHPELACFESWREVLAYVDEDPQGDELALMVRLIEEYGVQIVVDALSGLPAEDDADVIVSTAHVSKGREWPTVRLGYDFQTPDDGPPGDAERRLGYVACTRARERLDITQCEWLTGLPHGKA
jgi:superfamily I DNA/RNA helicase